MREKVARHECWPQCAAKIGGCWIDIQQSKTLSHQVFLTLKFRQLEIPASLCKYDSGLVLSSCFSYLQSFYLWFSLFLLFYLPFFSSYYTPLFSSLVWPAILKQTRHSSLIPCIIVPIKGLFSDATKFGEHFLAQDDWLGLHRSSEAGPADKINYYAATGSLWDRRSHLRHLARRRLAGHDGNGRVLGSYRMYQRSGKTVFYAAEKENQHREEACGAYRRNPSGDPHHKDKRVGRNDRGPSQKNTKVPYWVVTRKKEKKKKQQQQNKQTNVTRAGFEA